MKNSLKRARFYTAIKTSTLRKWINAPDLKDGPDTTSETKSIVFKRLELFDIDLNSK